MDSFLKPHVVEIPAHLQNTKDFINKTEGSHIPHSAMLDVAALYTNILHPDTRQCIQKNFGSQTGARSPTHFLLDLVLEKIFFSILTVSSVIQPWGLHLHQVLTVFLWLNWRKSMIIRQTLILFSYLVICLQTIFGIFLFLILDPRLMTLFHGSKAYINLLSS